MRFSLNLRKWLTACTLVLMLLAQQSVAADACTTSLQDMAQAAAAMPDCEDNSAAVSALCLKHCAAGSEAPGQPDVASTAIAAPPNCITLLYKPRLRPAQSMSGNSSSPTHPLRR